MNNPNPSPLITPTPAPPHAPTPRPAPPTGKKKKPLLARIAPRWRLPLILFAVLLSLVLITLGVLAVVRAVRGPAPTLTLHTHAVFRGDTVTAEDFIASVSADTYTASMETDGNLMVPGLHAVTVTVKNEKGASASGEAWLYVFDIDGTVNAEAGGNAADYAAIIRTAIPGATVSEQTVLDILSRTPIATTTVLSVPVSLDGYHPTVHLCVADTTPPHFTAQAVYALLGQPVAAEDFCTAVTDATPITYTLSEEVFTEEAGTFDLRVTLTDGSGNSASAVTRLYVLPIPYELVAEAGQSAAEVLAGVTDDTDYTLSEIAGLGEGTHTASLHTPHGTLPIRILIGDSVPPTATAVDVTYFTLLGEEVPTADDFVFNVTDATAVTVTFLEEVDFTTAGEREVTILLTDRTGNTATVVSRLTVVTDVIPPTIRGTKDINVLVGGRVSYRTGITATDKNGKSLSLSVDSSSVNLGVPGVYRVVYSATDSAGITMRVPVTLTVSEITEDVVRPHAETVLKKILRDGMTQREQARAIYDWVVKNLAYTAATERTYYLRGAYTGFTVGRGDGFTYYATSRVLLEAAGIQNLEIHRNSTTNPHFWNLVNCGDGWYHFDTCPHYRSYPLDSFMLTDREVAAYSRNCVKDYYSFDASLYPATPDK